MSGLLPRLLLGWAVFGILASPLPAPADEDPSEGMLSKINAVKLPEFDQARRDDRDYIAQYFKQRDEAEKRRAELIGELFRTAPEHPELPRLMADRWAALHGSPFTVEQVEAEIEAILADEAHPLRVEAAHFRALSTVRMGRGDEQKALDAIESFIALAPEDDRGARLLYQAATYALPNLPADRKQAILARVLEDYPDSPAAAQARGTIRQTEGLGKPFDLTFNDAITGRTISVQDDLKGKVVVVDFWATWCGPCIAEMPNMKQLYAEYKDKGVEFIGVSLDQPEEDGGLDALKDYVRENEIAWPQYYQGDAWGSEFSQSWGINAIPALFVIDQQGNLHSNRARGQLDRMIPELLERGASAGEN